MSNELVERANVWLASGRMWDVDCPTTLIAAMRDELERLSRPAPAAPTDDEVAGLEKRLTALKEYDNNDRATFIARDAIALCRRLQSAPAAPDSVLGALPSHGSDSQRGQRRVVCAANRIKDRPDFIVLGARHWDTTMHRAAAKAFGEDYDRVKWEQGFIDQKGIWMSREEAWKVAEAAGQIIRRVGSDTIKGGHLFSENLY